MDTLTTAGLGLIVVPAALALYAARGRFGSSPPPITPAEGSMTYLEAYRAQLDVLGSAGPDPTFANLPVRMDRRAAAAMISQHFFPISPRTLEAWPLPKRRLNGKALYETADLIDYAKTRVAASSVTRAGNRPHN